MEPVIREFFPEAQIYWTEDGIISTPREVVEALKTSLVAAAGSQTYHRQP
jgi:hypothetical protein